MRIRPVALFALLIAFTACVDKTMTGPVRTRAVRPLAPRRTIYLAPDSQHYGVAVGTIQHSDSLAVERFQELGASWASVLFWESTQFDAAAHETYNDLDTVANILGKIQGVGLDSNGHAYFPLHLDTDAVLAAWIDSLVHQYDKIHYWTYGNEVNCDKSPDSVANWAKYLDKLHIVDSVLATESNGDYFVAGELGACPDRKSNVSALQQIAAHTPHAIGFSMHWYGAGSTIANWVHNAEGSGVVTASQPIWLTEFGAATDTVSQATTAGIIDTVFGQMNGDPRWTHSLYYLFKADSAFDGAVDTGSGRYPLLHAAPNQYTRDTAFYEYERIARGCAVVCARIYNYWSQNDILFANDSTTTTDSYSPGVTYLLNPTFIYVAPGDKSMGVTSPIYLCVAWDATFSGYRHYLSTGNCYNFAIPHFSSPSAEVFLGYVSSVPRSGMVPVYEEWCQNNDQVQASTDASIFSNWCYHNAGSGVLGYTWNGNVFLSLRSTAVSGPTTLTPSSPSGTWSVFVNGGVPPYTISWSGLLSGTGSSVSGTISSSGTLYLDITDAVGTHISGSLDVIYTGCPDNEISCH